MSGQGAHGLPFVRLQKGLYAYMAGDVLEWLGRMRKASVSIAPNPTRRVALMGLKSPKMMGCSAGECRDKGHGPWGRRA